MAMQRNYFTVLFFLKKSKLLKNGEAPICMRITINGKRAEGTNQAKYRCYKMEYAKRMRDWQGKEVSRNKPLSLDHKDKSKNALINYSI